MDDRYDLICVGTSFAASFFLCGYLRDAKPTARVLVLERGERHSHSDLNKLRWEIRKDGDKTYFNRTPDKPWWYAPTFGGTSNIWYGNTPRLLPEDFRLHSSYGQGVDWPLSYDDLEPHYLEAERLMNVAGSDRPGPSPRSGPYPLPPHALSEPERWLEKAQPEHFFPCPTARASSAVPEQRPPCCASNVCNFCPVNAKFTVQNGLAKLFEDPRVVLLLGANVQSLLLENEKVSGVHFDTKQGARTARAPLVALGANALFNPYILLRSGFEDRALGRYLHEQVGTTAYAYLEKGEAFGGSTSCTGLNFRAAHGPHRKERAALLLETYSKPQIRLESKRWRNILRVVGVVEDLPQVSARVTVDRKRKCPATHFRNHSDYAKKTLERFKKDLPDLLEGLSIERLEVGKARATEGHILGTARMGEDAATSVVDSFQRKHAHPNLFVLGGSSFPTGGVSNPSLTIAALSLRSAKAALEQAV